MSGRGERGVEPLFSDSPRIRQADRSIVDRKQQLKAEISQAMQDLETEPNVFSPQRQEPEPVQTNALREQVRLHQKTQVLVEEVEALGEQSQQVFVQSLREGQEQLAKF